MTEPTSARQQLARDLKYLRESAGLSERALAERLGINQSTVQRMETAKGKTAASLRVQIIEQWADVTDARPHMRSRLRILVDAILTQDMSWRDKLGNERSHFQDEIRAREAAAHTVRNFQPTIVPGLLQTPEYAHLIIPIVDLEGVIDHAAAAASRLERQQALFTGERQFEFLLTEAALHWPASESELRDAQLDRIIALASLKAVSIAVLPLGEPVNAAPWTNFVIFDGDESYVSVEMSHREELVTDERRVSLYRSLYSKMWARAAAGADAVALIQRVAAELSAN
jgi:transcriptional regulator with XRE-family HTH domain